jgi:hypothetical protein
MRHAATIRKKWSTDESKQILDIVFEEYESRWANRDYPRPSLGQVASWLGDKAAEIAQERSKQVERYDEPEHGGQDTERLLQLLGGGAV